MNSSIEWLEGWEEGFFLPDEGSFVCPPGKIDRDIKQTKVDKGGIWEGTPPSALCWLKSALLELEYTPWNGLNTPLIFLSVGKIFKMICVASSRWLDFEL